MTAGVAPQFIANLKRTLAYWQAQAAARAPEALAETKAEWQNIAHAIGLGLNQPETWADASELSLALHRSVDATGRWTEWRTLLETAVRLAPADAPAQVRHLCNFLGLSQVMAGDRDSGRATLQAVLAEAEADDDAFNQMQAHVGLALDAFYSGQPGAVEGHATHALTLLEAIGGSEDVRINMLHFRGLAAREHGKYTESIRDLTEVVAMRRQLGPATELARALENLAVVECLTEDYSMGEAHLLEGLSLVPPVGADQLLNHLRLTLGWMHYRKADYEAALAAFLKVDRAWMKRTNQSWALAEILNNIASCLNKLGRLAEAEAYIHDSIAMYEQLGNPMMLANSVGVLAEVYAGLGRSAEARPQFERALDLLNMPMEDPWWIMRRKEIEEAYAALLHSLADAE